MAEPIDAVTIVETENPTGNSIITCSATKHTQGLDSLSSTLATTIETTENDETATEIHTIGTPQASNTPLRIEDELFKLKAKLLEIEEHAEQERLKRENLEREVQHRGAAFQIPAFFPIRESAGSFHDRTFNRGNEEYASDQHIDQIAHGYRRDKIELFNRELQALKREDEMMRNWNRERSMFTDTEERGRKEQAERTHRRTSSSGDSGSGTEVTIHDKEHPSVHVAVTPEHAIAELHYIEWAIFNSLRMSKEKDSFAIDVLNGEPIVTFDILPRIWWARKGRHLGKEDEKAKERRVPVSLKKPLVLGQAPLPERIRIHSKQILKILEKIHGETLSPDDTSIVMIRPFKALAYYREQIRQKYEELKTTFSVRVDTIEDESTTDPALLEVSNPITQDEESHNIAAENEDENEEKKDEKEDNNEDEDDNEDKDDNEDEDDNEDKDGEENDNTSSITSFQHLGCLIEFIDTHIQEKLNYLASDRLTKVAFTDIWYLFSPGDEVIGRDRRQVYRVISITSTGHMVIPPWRNYDKAAAKSEETPIFLNCIYIDFDGKQLGPVTKRVEIKRFDGEKTVTSLEVYPLRFAEDITRKGDKESKETFREELISRGQKFIDVAAVKHMHYDGITLETRDEVDSQVMIDFEEAFSSKDDKIDNKDWRPTIEYLIGKPMEEETDIESCDAECCRYETIHDDSYVEKKRNEEYIGSLIPEDRSKDPSVAIYPRALQDTKSPENALTDDDLVIMSYRVFGFVLRSRKWGKSYSYSKYP